MQPTRSRRGFLAASSLAVLSTAGCLFGAAHSDRAETVFGQLGNDTGEPIRATLTLTRPDGTVDFDRTYDLSPLDAPEFEVQNPATEYALAIESDRGASDSVEWDVTPCSSWVHVGVGEDAVNFDFSVC